MSGCLRSVSVSAVVASIVITTGLSFLQGCSREPAWKAENDRLIREHGVQVRTRQDIPEIKLTSNLTPGAPSTVSQLPETAIAPGVTARMVWGNGILLSRTTFAPGAETPLETLPAERIMVVMKGSVEQRIGSKTVAMSALEYERMTPVSGHRERHELVFLDAGSESAVKAGPDGAEILEIYAPVRTDYLKLAGVVDIPSSSQSLPPVTEPSLSPGIVTDLYNVQFTMLTPESYGRIISGQRMQVCFLTLDPAATTGFQAEPEENLSLVIRGSADMTAPGYTGLLEPDRAIHIPGGMVRSLTAGETGLDMLEIWQPERPDYTERMKDQAAKYHAVIPEDSSIELVVDGAVSGPGLLYCEGPSWVEGKLYFSNMWYDAAWTGDPSKSGLIEMDPDGSYRYKSKGMELNGTFPMPDKNLAICDMYNHRVIEMTTSGKVVRVLADKYDGKRIDGPNDIVVDDKGGVYFTDPQILPEPFFQPGRSVFYRRPDGTVIRVMDPGTLVKPNGLILNPDQSILYVNSTHENFMLAYDVAPDGSTSNPRKFGKILLTPEILDQKSINPQTDGMTVDEMGNVYITSMLGLQIFEPSGAFLGYIHFPLMPVNCCFGDPDGKTLYVTCNDKVYRIRMNVRGAEYTLRGM